MNTSSRSRIVAALPNTTQRIILVLAVAVFSTGCMSLENEEGRLPDAVRSAISTLSAKGYPDLTKLPEIPTDLPSGSNWSAVEARLVSQGEQLSQNPGAALPSADETNLNWAEKERAALNNDPRALPLEIDPSGTTNDPNWAIAARAKLEADLARLPPY